MIHANELLDRISSFSSESFAGEIFRATRMNLDPIAPSSCGGRWAPRNGCPVLYSSLLPEGALAEIAFHWGMLSPLPSKPVKLHRLRAQAKETLRLLRSDFSALGIDPARYDGTNYARTQEIGAALAFLGYDGLIAPSARWDCDNLMIFTDNLADPARIELIDSEEIDWQAWARSHGLLSDAPA